MDIQRMGFIQYDHQTGSSQTLFLLRSGHDLECGLIVMDGTGAIVQEFTPLRYTLIDRHAILLDKYELNTKDNVEAWRKVLLACFECDMMVPKPRNGAVLMGVHSVVAFGEPFHQDDESLIIISVSMRRKMSKHLRDIAKRQRDGLLQEGSNVNL